MSLPPLTLPGIRNPSLGRLTESDISAVNPMGGPLLRSHRLDRIVEEEVAGVGIAVFEASGAGYPQVSLQAPEIKALQDWLKGTDCRLLLNQTDSKYNIVITHINMLIRETKNFTEFNSLTIRNCKEIADTILVLIRSLDDELKESSGVALFDPSSKMVEASANKSRLMRARELFFNCAKVDASPVSTLLSPASRASLRSPSSSSIGTPSLLRPTPHSSASLSASHSVSRITSAWHESQFGARVGSPPDIRGDPDSDSQPVVAGRLVVLPPLNKSPPLGTSTSQLGFKRLTPLGIGAAMARPQAARTLPSPVPGGLALEDVPSDDES